MKKCNYDDAQRAYIDNEKLIKIYLETLTILIKYKNKLHVHIKNIYSKLDSKGSSCCGINYETIDQLNNFSIKATIELSKNIVLHLHELNFSDSKNIVKKSLCDIHFYSEQAQLKIIFLQHIQKVMISNYNKINTNVLK
jgi:hypothetical protein